ncbi:D-alanyl-D-alanine carboxypeptidase (penicillin-binding protein 5/6) [Mesorhizobium australicum]|uniref:serine-type D-Ala-D-Ala carboxypeptidase n=2 Tax=Mesorhizobium australicum TaxID=536018 RepID=A0A1X7PBQ7_9HYPH|nr:D-alanyl-D-alanine carboxypeptidase (penicillin-binding protein 5/6) [Mesorhizobium australicum]
MVTYSFARGLSAAMAVAISLGFSAGAAVAQFETKAARVYMIDAETGTTLYAKDPDAVFPPASLAKLMTMEVVFDALKSGRFSPETTFQVSEHAWRTGGAPSRTATMFAAVKSFVPLGDLIQGATVITANDACIVMAEGISGSEAGFTELMNERARQLGLAKSVFVNPTGLPADGQSVTVRDLVTLARHIWQAYPEFYPLYAQPEYKWNKINQQNRNPLIKLGIGADGLATGFAEGAGFGIVASAAGDGKRLFLAMSGMSSDKERVDESRKLIEWGMRAFRRIDIFAADETVGEARTYGGEKARVRLSAHGPVSMLVPAENRDKVIARIVYEGPVEAPIEAGQPVGKLKVWVGDMLTQETPLYAAESVGVGSLWQRTLDALEELAIGWLR